MKTFDNEWIFQVFEDHPSFLTKRMFGGLAVHAHHSRIIKEFPELAPHVILKKWLYIDSRDEDFEPTMEKVARAIARDDQRFGIRPDPRKNRFAARRRRHWHLAACNSEIGTVRSSVGAVYDRPICRSCKTVGVIDRPYRKPNGTEISVTRP